MYPSLDCQDPGYSINGNLTISSRLARVTLHQIFQRHIAKVSLAKRDYMYPGHIINAVKTFYIVFLLI